MLEEAYRWRLGAAEKGWSRDETPIMHFAWVLDPGMVPSERDFKFELDLATMRLRTQEGTFQLPLDGDGKGEEERELWRHHVVPILMDDSDNDWTSLGWTPRLLMRHGAYSLYE